MSRTSRRDLLLVASLGLAVNSFAQPRRRPNILFLFTDDQRWNTVHALNNPAVQTPNLDRLVRRGTSFDHACIMGGTIGAVCAPSRGMLMTGQTLFHVHNSDLVPKGNEPGRNDHPYTLFPDVLRKSGYTTFATGKWHNGEKSFARAFSRGGNIFFGGMSDHLQVPLVDFDPSGQYPKNQRHIGQKFSSELFSDAAVEFLEQYKGPDPFLLYVAYTAPHDPRMAPPEYARMYPPEKMALPPNFQPEHPFDNGEMKIRDEALAPWPRTPELVREHLAAYYAMITEVDAQIGRVLQALETSGHADNTIIIFAADNGLAVGQHGLLGKQNLYDHSVRVPLVIQGPGIPQGKTASSLCYLLDLAPTIYELTGTAAPDSTEGISLVPVLRAPGRHIRDSVFLAYGHVQRGVRTDRWKLIKYNVQGKVTTQLFDLNRDPWETQNLAGDSKYSATVRELTDLLRTWMRKIDDFLDLDQPNWGWSASGSPASRT